MDKAFFDKVFSRQRMQKFFDRHPADEVRQYGIKNCGSLEVASSAVIQAQDSDVHSYRLSAEGLKAVSLKERPLYLVKSLAARKVHKLNVLLSK